MSDSPEDYETNNIQDALLSYVSCSKKEILNLLPKSDKIIRKELLELFRDYQNIELKIVALKGGSDD